MNVPLDSWVFSVVVCVCGGADSGVRDRVTCLSHGGLSLSLSATPHFLLTPALSASYSICCCVIPIWSFLPSHRVAGRRDQREHAVTMELKHRDVLMSYDML